MKPILPFLLFYLVQGAAVAAPMNDDFANRTDLGNAATVARLGSNVEATLEPGERDHGISGSSVWYAWTAPAAGWVQVDTIGATSLDTVVGIYKLNGLTRSLEGFSDGSDQTRLVEGIIRFEAEANGVYAIQVSGWRRFITDSANEGEFVLNVQQTPGIVPVKRPQTVTITPDIVDSSVGSTQVTTTVTFSDGSSDFGVWFYKANGDSLYFLDDEESQDVPRTLKLTVGKYTPAGFYTLLIRGFDELGEAWGGPLSGAPNVLGSQFPSTITINNSGPEDKTAPEMSSMALSQTSVNTRDSEVEIKLTIQVTDDLSGFRAANINFEKDIYRNEAGYSSDLLTSANIRSIHRVSGTETNGTYEITLTVAQRSLSGVYEARISLADNAANSIDLPLNAAWPKITVVGMSRYESWADSETTYGNDDPSADVDENGINNLLCYAFNLPGDFGEDTARYLSPSEEDGPVGGLPYVSVTEGEPHLQIEFIRRLGDSTLSYAPEFCSDPKSAGGVDGWKLATTTEEVVALPYGWERVRLVDSQPLSQGMKRFARVRVSLQGP